MQIGKYPRDKIYAESIKPIRNQMRRYSYQSLLDALLVYLNVQSTGDRQKDLQRLPWVVERLAIWLLADKAHEYGSQIAAEQDVKRLIDLAWRTADKLYGNGQPIKDLGLFVRQMMLPQAPYQQTLDSHALGLQLYLIRRLPTNSKLRRFLDEKAAMPIEEYFELAVLYWAHSISAKPWFNQQYIDALAILFPPAQQMKFIASFTSQLSALQHMCRERTIHVDEWFQPTCFYKTPCLYHEGAAVSFGSPTLRRYFEALISDWIAEFGSPDLRQNFDKLVEEYVAEALRRSQLNFITENDIKELVPTGQVVDFLIDEPDGIVLIEVKNKSLSQSIPASREPLELAARLKATIVKAQSQLANTEKALKLQPKYQNKIFYRIVVTNSDLWLSRAEWLLTKNEEHISSSPTWLVSLRELDMLVEVIKTKPHTLTNILTRFSENQKNNLSATYSLEAFLERDKEKPRKIPSHLLQEVEMVFDKAKAKLLSQ